MAAIAASDVTYARTEGTQYASPANPKVCAVYSITFGDGVDTYPSGGIPLTKGKLGCPTSLDEFLMIEADADDGYVYKFDKSTECIRIYQVAEVADTDPAAPLEELATSETPAATTLIVKVSGW